MMLKKIEVKTGFLIVAFLFSNIMFVTGTSVFTMQIPISPIVNELGKYCFLATVPSFLITIAVGFWLKGRKFFTFAPKVMISTFVIAALFVLPILWLIALN